MHSYGFSKSRRVELYGGLCMATLLMFSASGRAQQNPGPPENHVGSTSAMAATASTPGKTDSGPASSANWHAFDSTYYKRKWGVEIIGVRLVSSKGMLRFNYRVLDAEKAKTLNDKKFNPFLVDEVSGVKLGVPEMDKVGKLRQSSEPEMA